MVSRYIRIPGDWCFLISSSSNKTFPNPSDISFIPCFPELFRTLAKYLFNNLFVQFLICCNFYTLWKFNLYISFLLFFLHNKSPEQSADDTYYLTYETSFQFWESNIVLFYRNTLEFAFKVDRYGFLRKSSILRKSTYSCVRPLFTLVRLSQLFPNYADN